MSRRNFFSCDSCNALRQVLTALAFGALLAAAGRQTFAATRIGVITAKTPESENLAALLEVRLAKVPSVVLVERAAIEQVLREQELQALLAADVPGKRAALGKMLKADLLVFLAGNDKPKPHAMVTVCETQQGLRLCIEPVLLSANPETDAEAVFKQIEGAARKGREKIADIVAVPPLVNNSLTHEADRLQWSFAQLAERELLHRPGVVVVELAEAKALAQEMVVSSSAGIERRLPLYLMGEYRYEGAGEKRRGQFTWSLLRGQKELERRHEKNLLPDKMPEQLRLAAAELVDKVLGKSDVRFDAKAEAAALAGRARVFVALGFWHEALSLSEASLLLNYSQPAVHGYAFRAILEGVGKDVVSPPDDPKVIDALCAALPHLEAFFIGTTVAEEYHVYVDGRWWLRRIDTSTPEGRDACCQLYRDMCETANRILAAKAAAKKADCSLELLACWTEMPVELPVDARYHLWNLTVPEYDASLKPEWEAWLAKNLAVICQHRLKLLRDFAWLKSKGKNDYYGAFEKLITMTEPELGDAPLVTNKVYLDFLSQVQKLPNPDMRVCAKDCERRIRGQPKRLAGIEQRVREYERNPPPPTPPKKQISDPDIVFHPLAFKVPLPDGREESLVSEAESEPPTTEPLWAVEAWTGLYDGCDFVVFRKKSSDESSELSLTLMKQKGQLGRLPLDIALSHRGGYSGADRLLNSCWDGQYLWALNPGKEGPLAVIEPREEKIWKVGAESGLPPSTSCAITPLEKGKVCIAGYFGRLWVALASFDGQKINLDVFYEARDVPKPSYHHPDPSRHSPKLARPIEFMSTVTEPGASGRAPRQRVVIGREYSGPLLVDPQTRSVTSLPYDIEPEYCFCGDDGVYWHEDTGPKRELLCRIGFPSFEKKVVNPATFAKNGIFFAGHFHEALGRYDYGPSRNPRWCQLRANFPAGRDGCFFLSHHYGMLLSNVRGVFMVELKNPLSPEPKPPQNGPKNKPNKPKPPGGKPP